MHRSETNPDDNWYDYTYTRGGKEYESYWRDPHGIDRGEPSRGTYVLHATVGHHGIFSLTPIWLLSVWGLSCWAGAMAGAGPVHRHAVDRLPGVLPVSRPRSIATTAA